MYRAMCRHINTMSYTEHCLNLCSNTARREEKTFDRRTTIMVKAKDSFVSEPMDLMTGVDSRSPGSNLYSATSQKEGLAKYVVICLEST